MKLAKFQVLQNLMKFTFICLTMYEIICHLNPLINPRIMSEKMTDLCQKELNFCVNILKLISHFETKLGRREQQKSMKRIK